MKRYKSLKAGNLHDSQVIAENKDKPNKKLGKSRKN